MKTDFANVLQDFPKVKLSRVFKANGESFDALHRAEAFAKKQGMVHAPLCGDRPVGLANAKKYNSVSKWHNLDTQDRQELQGLLLSNDFRDGDVFAVLF